MREKMMVDHMRALGRRGIPCRFAYPPGPTVAGRQRGAGKNIEQHFRIFLGRDEIRDRKVANPRGEFCEDTPEKRQSRQKASRV